MKSKHILPLLLTLALLLAVALPAFAADGPDAGGLFPLPSFIPTMPPIGTDTEVTVNDRNFPDRNFRAYISENFGRKAGLTTVVDTEAVTEIACAGLSIARLKGVELFPHLAVLDCSDNLLSALDVSENTELNTLICAGNASLGELDVQSVPALLDAVENGEMAEEEGVLSFESEHGALVLDGTTALTGYHYLRFDLNGGEGDFPLQLVRDGEAALCPDWEPENGENWFTGWYLGSACYDWDVPVTRSLTLVAGWAAPCLVTLDFAGGEYGGESGMEIECCVGMTLRRELPTPVWPGKQFTGWLLNGEPYDLDAPLTGDLHLTASWVDAWTLHFDRGSEHDDGAGHIDDITVPAGEAQTVSFFYERYGTQPTVLHDDGDWQFLGWDFEPDALPGAVAFPLYENGADKPLPGPYTVELDGDVTLYAIYGKAPAITVMKNDGSGQTASGVVQKRGVYSRLMIGSNLRRDGFDLYGFSRDPDAAEPDKGLERRALNKSNYVYYYAEEDVTLYAVWGEKRYELRFDLNGGEGELPESLLFTMKDKPVLTLPGAESVSKAHRTLLGWALINTSNYNARMTDVDYGREPLEAVFAPGTVLPAESLRASDLTLYAVWQYEPIVVSLDPLGLTDYPTAESYPMYYNYGANKSANAAGAPTGHPATPNTRPAAKPFPAGYEPEEGETENAFAAWLDQDGAAYAPRSIATVKDGTALLPNDRDTALLAVWEHTFVSFLDPAGEVLAREDFVYDAEKPARVHLVEAPEPAEVPGLLFLGWEEETNGERFQPGDVLEIPGERCFRALYLDLDRPDCVLPSSLTSLESGALANTGFRFAVLPEGLTALPGGVFAGCESLLAVAVPPSVTEIAPDALLGAGNAVLLGVVGSAAERFAAAQGLDFLPLEAEFFA